MDKLYVIIASLALSAATGLAAPCSSCCTHTHKRQSSHTYTKDALQAEDEQGERDSSGSSYPARSTSNYSYENTEDEEYFEDRKNEKNEAQYK